MIRAALCLSLVAVGCQLSTDPTPDEPRVPHAPKAVAPPGPVSLPAPFFSLDFENATELASKGVTVTTTAGQTNQNAYVTGRSRLALRAKNTVLSKAANAVITPVQGTFAIWVRNDSFDPTSPNNLTGSNPLVLFDTSNDGSGWMARLMRNYGADDKKMRATFGATLAQQRWTDAPLTGFRLGVWRHYALTWSTQAVRLYVDGSLVSQWSPGTDFPQTIPTGTRLFLLSSARNPIPSDGKFSADMLRTYASALTDLQVATLYRQGVSVGPLLTAQSEGIAIQLAGARDGFGIRDIWDSQVGERKKQPLASRALWRATLKNLTTGVLTEVTNTSVEGAVVTSTVLDGTTTLTWTGIPIQESDSPSAPVLGTLDVTVDAAPYQEQMEIPSIGFKVGSVVHSTRHALIDLTVLELNDLSAMGVAPAQTSLVLPDHTVGRNLPNPFAAPLSWTLPSTLTYPVGASGAMSDSASMQWFAISTNDDMRGGLYVGAHDPEGWIKEFRFTQNGVVNADGSTGVTLNAAIGIPGIDITTPGNELKTHWPVVLSLVPGTWFDHAQRYRAFALSTPWMSKGPLASRSDVPLWMKQAGLFNPGASSWISRSVDSNWKVAGAPSGLVMFHYAEWHGLLPQVNDMPFVRATSVTTTELALAASVGIPSSLYFNPVLWDVLNDVYPPALFPNRNELIGESIIAEDGNPLSPYTGYADSPGYAPVYTCASSSAWRSAALTPLATLLSTSAVQGVYLDQVAALAPRTCHATDHGHPIGAGTHWVEGRRDLIVEARAAMQAGQGIYTEGFAEPYVDVVDGFLQAYTANEYAVPLAQAVYHDYVQFLGRNVELKTVGRSAYHMAPSAAKQIELLVWGGMPGYLTTSLNAGALESFQAHMLTLARARRTFGSHLVDGAMLRAARVGIRSETPVGGAPELVSEEAALDPVPFVSHVTTYTTRGVPQTATWRGPAVLTSSWRGSDGTSGVLYASSRWNDAAVDVVDLELSRDLAPTSATAGTTLAIRHVTHDGKTSLLGMTTLPAHVRVEVSAGNVGMLVVAPATVEDWAMSTWLQTERSPWGAYPDYVFDVSKMGAVADDAIDDSAAIQTAINQAIASRTTPGNLKAAVVYLPRGKYLIGTQLSVNLGNASTAGIVLDGDGSTLEATTDGMSSVLYVSPGQFMDIKKLHINANNRAINGLRTFKYGGGYSGRIEQVMVERAKEDGFFFEDSQGGIVISAVAIANGRHGFNFTGSNASICRGCIALANHDDGALVTKYSVTSGGWSLIDFVGGHNARAGARVSSLPTQALAGAALIRPYLFKNAVDGLVINARNVSVDEPYFVEPTELTAGVTPRALRYDYQARGVTLRDPNVEGGASYATIARTLVAANPAEYAARFLGAAWPEVVETMPTTLGSFVGLSAPMTTELALRCDAAWGAAGSGAGPRYLNVSGFGAIPNDGIDDTAALQSALDAVFVVGPGLTAVGVSLLLPLGEYVVSAPLRIAASPLGYMSPIMIEGAFSTLRPAPGFVGDSIFEISGNRPVRIERLVVLAPNVAHGLKVTSTGDVLLRQVSVSYAAGDGFAFEAAERLNLENVVAYSNAGDGIQVASGVQELVCAQCEALLNGGNGFTVERTGNRASFEGVLSEKNIAGYGVHVLSDDGDVVFAGGWFEGNALDAFRLDTVSGGAPGDASISGLVIAARPVGTGVQPGTRHIRFTGAWDVVRAYGNAPENAGVTDFHYPLIPMSSIHDEVFGSFARYNPQIAASPVLY